MVEQYLDLSREILSSKRSRLKFNDRRGLGRIYLFGAMNIHDLNEGFPLLTTKKVPFKMVAHELVWFLQGETNIKYLVDNNVPIWNDDAFNHNLPGMVREGLFSEVFEKYSPAWDSARDEYVQRVGEDEEFSERWGDLGPVYGSQWIHSPFFTPTGEQDSEGRDLFLRDPNGIDQIATTLHNMRKNVTSARHVVSAWNPSEVAKMALPPCHTMFQLNSDSETLDLMLTQRACDMFLGVPFNEASYSMMATIFAQELDLGLGYFVHSFADVHFYTGAGERAKWYRDNFDSFKSSIGRGDSSEHYENVLEALNRGLPPEPEGKEGMDHVTGILEQLARTPRKSPRVTISDKPYNELTIDDFELEGYDPHPAIRRALAV